MNCWLFHSWSQWVTIDYIDIVNDEKDSIPIYYVELIKRTCSRCGIPEYRRIKK